MNGSKRWVALAVALWLLCMPFLCAAAEGVGEGATELTAAEKLASIAIEQGFSQEKPEQAIRYFQNAAKVAPKSPDILYTAGVGCYMYGDMELAVSYMRQSVELGGANVIQHTLDWTSVLSEMDRTDDAIEALKGAMGEGEPDPLLFSQMMQLLVMDDRTDEAAQIAEEMVAKYPESAMLMVQRSLLNGEMYDYDAAIADGERAIEMAPDMVGGYHALIVAYTYAGRFQEADRALAKLLNGMDEEELWLQRADLRLQKMHNPEKALEDLDALLRMDPEWPEALAMRIHAYLAVERYEDAMKDADTLLQIEGFEVMGRTMRALVSFVQEDLVAAQAEFDVLEKDAPEDSLALFYRAVFENDVMNRPDAAQTYLDRYIALNYEDADALSMLGDVARVQGRWLEAAQYYLRASEMAYQEPGHLAQLTVLQMSMGHVEDATKTLADMEKVYPGWYNTLYMKMLMQSVQGEAEQALETYDALLAKFPAQAKDLLPIHCLLLLEAGQTAEGLALIDEAYPVAECDAGDWNDRAYAFLYAGDFAKAEDALAQGTLALTAEGTTPATAHNAGILLLVTRAELQMAQKDQDTALKTLEEACEKGWQPAEAGMSHYLRSLLEDATFKTLMEKYPIK